MLLNANRRNRRLENFQGHCLESNLEPPILRRNALSHRLLVMNIIIIIIISSLRFGQGLWTVYRVLWVGGGVKADIKSNTLYQ